MNELDVFDSRQQKADSEHINRRGVGVKQQHLHTICYVCLRERFPRIIFSNMSIGLMYFIDFMKL